MAAPPSTFEAQQAAQLSAQELKDLTRELFNWSKDAKKKSGRKGLAAQATPASAATVTAGGQSSGSGATQPQQQAGPTSTARHPAGHTYEHYRTKWDKFDADAAASDDDEKSGGSAAVNGSRPRASGGIGGPRSSASEPMAIPEARITVPVKPSPPRAADGAAAPATAESWKDAGNQHFKHGRYSQAVEAYTSSLALQPTCLAAANRAMARLKLGQYEAAEADCEEALRLDPLYVKAYQRRATARRQLGKLLGAVEDYESVVRLEPSNKQAAADRAECARQVLEDAGLQVSSRSEQLEVRLAAPPAQTIAAAAAVDSAAHEEGGLQEAAVGGSGVEELLVPVSSVQRRPVDVQPGEGASIVDVAAGQAGQPTSTLVQQLSPATPTASVQVEMMDADDSLPDLPELQQGQPPQQVQELAALKAAGKRDIEAIDPEQQQPAELPAAVQELSAAASQPAPMDVDAAEPAAPELAAAQQAVAAPAIPAAAAEPPAAQQPPASVQLQAPAPLLTPAPVKVPRTGVEFEKAWKALAKGDVLHHAAYLLALQPAQLPSLLRQTLTPALLAAAVGALLGPGLQQQPGKAVALLEGLPQVPRFDINLLSVPPQQKAELAAAWEAAQAELADGELASRLEAIRPKYKL